MPTKYSGFCPIAPLLLLCSLQVANAQARINVCGVDLRIGMAKDRVIQAASSGCEVKRFRDTTTDLWCARPAELLNSRLPPYAGCHNLQFESGLLVSIEKEIGEAHDEKAAGVLDRVFSFLKAAEDASQTVTVSPSSETEFAGLRFRTIDFKLGQRSLSLTITQPIGSARGIPEVRLTESLQSAHLPTSQN